VVSILGFVSIALDSFGLWDVRGWLTGLIFIVVGGGLMIEGSPRALIKYMAKGLNPDEATHVLAIIFGLFGIIAGILTILNIGAPMFETVKGFLSVFMIILIILETWVVK